MSLTNDHWSAWISKNILKELEADKALDRKLAQTRGNLPDDIKDSETVCEHGARPFECRYCRIVRVEQELKESIDVPDDKDQQ